MVREGWGSARGEPDEGADVIEYLSTDPKLEGVTGKYFHQRRESKANRQAYDHEARRRLWQLSLELTGAREP
jgi:hypothetical protein